jgi:probable rRNA maturation factor
MKNLTSKGKAKGKDTLEVSWGHGMEIFLSGQEEGQELDEESAALLQETLATVARLEQLADTCQVSVTLVGDAEMREINHAYRKVDKITDVISFALNEGEEEELQGGPEANLLGEIVVCLPQCWRQAEEYGHGRARELAYLLAHGMLHILGYDHMREAEKKTMRQREKAIMTAIGLARI